MTSFTLGTFKATEPMRQLINQVLDTGRLSYGPLSRKFETEFARMHGRAYGVLSNSGTSSLQVALQALKEMYGWADGDEVIVPALTFVATINIVYHCRLTPVLVDIEPDYYAIDPALIEAAITPRTRCIIPVHPFGQSADMGSIRAIAEAHNLAIVEDSCEAMFVQTEGKYVGSWGDVGCFSTYVAHLITGGVGGIGITADPDLDRSMRSLVNHGIDLDEMPSGTRYDPSFLARNFRFRSVGHSFRVTEMEAALLLPQLETAGDIIATRRFNAGRIDAILRTYADHVQLPRVRPGSEHSWMVYAILLRDMPKEPLMRFLRQRRVECRDALPLTNQPCYDFDPALYPVAEKMNQQALYIGTHQGLEDEQFAHLSDVFQRWFQTYRQFAMMGRF